MSEESDFWELGFEGTETTLDAAIDVIEQRGATPIYVVRREEQAREWVEQNVDPSAPSYKALLAALTEDASEEDDERGAV